MQTVLSPGLISYGQCPSQHGGCSGTSFGQKQFSPAVDSQRLKFVRKSILLLFKQEQFTVLANLKCGGEICASLDLTSSSLLCMTAGRSAVEVKIEGSCFLECNCRASDSLEFKLGITILLLNMKHFVFI